MKIHFKAQDNTKKELEMIEDFYRAKYNNDEIEDLSINDPSYKINTFIVKWRKGLIDYVVSLDYEKKLVAKAAQPNLEWALFEKDELKLFDLLDYDINSIHKKEMKQDITDWITEDVRRAEDEDNVFGPEIDYNMNKIKAFYLELEQNNIIYNLDFELFEDEEVPYLQLRFITKQLNDNKKINNYLVGIDFGNKEISQLRDAIYMPFTIEELKFFDLLGFDLEYTHSYQTRQDITDWIGKI